MNPARTFSWPVLALAAVALAIAAVPSLAPLLAFDRDGILAGELWRLLTGHLVHASTYHLTWNVAGLLGLGWLFGRTLGRELPWALLTGALVISGGLLLFDPGLELYVGLSGLLNTLVAAGALATWKAEQRQGGSLFGHACIALLLLDLAKIAVESSVGPLFVDTARLGGFAVPLAHALGALGGMLFLAFSRSAPSAHLDSEMALIRAR